MAAAHVLEAAQPHLIFNLFNLTYKLCSSLASFPTHLSPAHNPHSSLFQGWGNALETLGARKTLQLPSSLELQPSLNSPLAV